LAGGVVEAHFAAKRLPEVPGQGVALEINKVIHAAIVSRAITHPSRGPGGRKTGTAQPVHGTEKGQPMTEAEWLKCEDPQPMLDFLRGKASERKLGLYDLACCRHIWHLLVDVRSQQAVEIAERFVDRLADRADLDRARKLAAHATWAIDHEREVAGMETSRRRTLRAAEAVEYTLRQISGRVGVFCLLEPLLADEDEATQGKQHAGLNHSLRCIFGPMPFRPVSIHPAWRSATVTSLAQAIYDERAFDRLPILADALEDAGCTNADLLGHCRGGGEHVRGCWVVDLVLGKE
jgi:hypothetical protein